MLLQGRSSRSVHKTLWARSFLQQHQGEWAANKWHVADLGSLLLVGEEAGKEHLLQINETGPQKPVRQSSWAVRQNPRTGGQELINNSDNDPQRCRMGTTLLPTCLIPNLPHPSSWLTLTQKGKNPPKAVNELGEAQVRKKPRWLEPGGLYAVEMKVEVLILLPWILTAARARAYSTRIPKNSTCLSNHTGPHGALFSLTSFWSNGILQLSKRRNGVFVVKHISRRTGFSSTLLQICCWVFHTKQSSS